MLKKIFNYKCGSHAAIHGHCTMNVLQTIIHKKSDNDCILMDLYEHCLFVTNWQCHGLMVMLILYPTISLFVLHVTTIDMDVFDAINCGWCFSII